jgi:hypothetical protein
VHAVTVFELLVEWVPVDDPTGTSGVVRRAVGRPPVMRADERAPRVADRL